jgi:uncharacterized protein YbaR (Trm112 family)
VHLLLTDRLTCPRCGPGFGLILLAHRLESRVVHEGVLGCPNCRDAFPVTGGFGDLRAPPRGERAPGLVGPPGSADTDEAARLLAQLGVLGGPGTVALVGEPARAATGVAEALPEIHVAAIDADLASWPETERVSRLVTSPGLPFFDASLRAVAVDARLGPEWIAEAARVVAPRGRAVVMHAAEGVEGVAAALENAGLRVLATDAETVVAARS